MSDQTEPQDSALRLPVFLGESTRGAGDDAQQRGGFAFLRWPRKGWTIEQLERHAALARDCLDRGAEPGLLVGVLEYTTREIEKRRKDPAVGGGKKPDQRAEQNTATAAIGVRGSEGVGMRSGAVSAGNEGRA